MPEPPSPYAWVPFQQKATALRRRIEQRALRRRGWYDLTARSAAEAIFIGGCGRSGTTLFRELLNRHPRIFCGPETSLFGLPFEVANLSGFWGLDAAELERQARESPNLVAFADAFYARFVAENGKVRWADKTPNNVRALPKLLTWYPNGRFIHLIRDGRDVACSLRKHPKEWIVDGKVVPTGIVRPISRCAERWMSDTSMGVALRDHPRCLEVRYEELVADTEGELRRVCEFLGEEYDAAMLDPVSAQGREPGRLMNNRNAGGAIESSSIGRWRSDLSAEERRVVDDIAGPLLVALSYAKDSSWVSKESESRRGVVVDARPGQVSGA